MNAAAIDPLIIVVVPGCLESVSFLGMVLDLNYEVSCFLVTSAVRLKLEHGSNVDPASLKSYFTARIC